MPWLGPITLRSWQGEVQRIPLHGSHTDQVTLGLNTLQCFLWSSGKKTRLDDTLQPDHCPLTSPTSCSPRGALLSTHQPSSAASGSFQSHLASCLSSLLKCSPSYTAFSPLLKVRGVRCSSSNFFFHVAPVLFVFT